MVKEIRWPLKVQTQLLKAYEYILQNSYQGAEKVKNDIQFSISNLSIHPETYPLDKYRKNNDGTYGAFELHQYRISYKINMNEIIIVRIRHAGEAVK